jgi:hypothetical protein
MLIKVDVKYEQTRDLFEKQRVRDEFVETRKEQLNYLIGYYENKFKYLQHNKYRYQIYENNYKMSNLTKLLMKRILFTTLMSGSLCMLNPLLLLIMIPEYYSIIYSFKFFNGVVQNITLSDDKQSISINKYNFLGRFN